MKESIAEMAARIQKQMEDALVQVGACVPDVLEWAESFPDSGEQGEWKCCGECRAIVETNEPHAPTCSVGALRAAHDAVMALATGEVLQRFARIMAAVEAEDWPAGGGAR